MVVSEGPGAEPPNQGNGNRSACSGQSGRGRSQRRQEGTSSGLMTAGGGAALSLLETFFIDIIVFGY